MPLTKEGSDKPDFHFVIAFVLEYKKRVTCTNIGGGNVLSGRNDADRDALDDRQVQSFARLRAVGEQVEHRHEQPSFRA